MPGASPDQLTSILRERFGLPGFRAMQREAIESILSGRDTLVVMPTGGGKSLCYQLPAVVSEGITLVVSPLIALMKDQVDRLTSLNIPAVAINSTLHFNQIRATLEAAVRGEIRVLFVAPERLESANFREMLTQLPIALMAIDEAHCISEWGHDFRTSYRRIPDVFEQFPGKRPPIMALTATATPDVRADIVRMLQLSDPLEIVTGFERENLSYGVLRESQKASRLVDLLQSLNGESAIVYATTRASVEKVTTLLHSKGISAASYHAGVQLQLRRRIQDRFQSGETPVIVATSAFGMGIDKPDIRAVVHYEMPGSIEAYYQEAGRAGRDGTPAMAVLLFSAQDIRTHEYLARLNTPSEAEVRSVYIALHDIAGNGVGSVYPEQLTVESAHILKYIVKPEASLERILELLEELGHVRIQRSGERELKPRVRFISGRARMEEILFRTNSKPLKTTISALLRTAGAEAFTSEVAVDDEELRRVHVLSSEEYQLAIRTLVGLGAIQYHTPTKSSPRGETFVLELLTERVPSHVLMLPGAQIRERMEHAEWKLGKMIEYATTWSCRTTQILHYFGERPEKLECGTCDVCAAKRGGFAADVSAVPMNP